MKYNVDISPDAKKELNNYFRCNGIRLKIIHFPVVLSLICPLYRQFVYMFKITKHKWYINFDGQMHENPLSNIVSFFSVLESTILICSCNHIRWLIKCTTVVIINHITDFIVIYPDYPIYKIFF